MYGIIQQRNKNEEIKKGIGVICIDTEFGGRN